MVVLFNESGAISDISGVLSGTDLSLPMPLSDGTNVEV